MLRGPIVPFEQRQVQVPLAEVAYDLHRNPLGPGRLKTTVQAGNGFNVTGGGSDIGGASDQFQFNYVQVAGDFDVKVRVAGLNLSDAWAKAGLMAREQLGAGSRFVGVGTTRTVGIGAIIDGYSDMRMQRLSNVLHPRIEGGR